MAFRYQAINAQGKVIHDTIDAASSREAADLLRDQGLFVSRLDEDEDTGERRDRMRPRDVKPGGRLREVVLFTQQIGMLLRSGARVVQALEAVEAQCQRPAWRAVVAEVREDVEEGKSFSVALGKYPREFPEYYVNMVAAGEASGDLPRSFSRLAALMTQQQQIRNRVLGAMAYPALLTLLCIGVMAAMLFFVLPRFAEMFDTLDVDLPASTAILLAMSDWIRHNGVMFLVIVASVVGAVILAARSAQGKRALSLMMLRVPVFGRLIRSLIVARICRIWGQLMESRVSLLEAVELTQNSMRNAEYRALLKSLADDITDGKSIGSTLMSTWLISRTLAAAILTGEESGKLSESLLFVADSLDDENQQALNSLTRIIEPIILVVMGVVVGTVAISLFLPMFDTATLAGH